MITIGLALEAPRNGKNPATIAQIEEAIRKMMQDRFLGRWTQSEKIQFIYLPTRNTLNIRFDGGELGFDEDWLHGFLAGWYEAKFR